MPTYRSISTSYRAGRSCVLGQFLPPTGKVANPYLRAGDNLVTRVSAQLASPPLAAARERGLLDDAP
jgi:hypothetical protein